MNPKDLEDTELHYEDLRVIVNDPATNWCPWADAFSQSGEFSEKISEDRPSSVEEMEDESEEPVAEEKTPAAIDQIQQIINQEKLKAYVEARDVLVETFRDDVLKDYIREVFREKFGV